MNDINDALKELYETLVDSRDGYDQAMENVESAHLKQVFQDMVSRRNRNIGELRTFLNQRGHEMDEDGSLLAAMHRQFLDLKSKVQDSDEAVLEEIVRGEEHVLNKYDAAIEPAGSTDPEFAFLVEQYNTLKEKVAEMKKRENLAA